MKVLRWEQQGGQRPEQSKQGTECEMRPREGRGLDAIGGKGILEAMVRTLHFILLTKLEIDGLRNTL